MKCYTCGKDLKDVGEPKYRLDSENKKFVKLKKGFGIRKEEKAPFSFSRFGSRGFSFGEDISFLLPELPKDDDEPIYCLDCVKKIVRYFRLRKKWMENYAKCEFCGRVTKEKYDLNNELGSEISKGFFEYRIKKEGGYEEDFCCSRCTRKKEEEAQKEEEDRSGRFHQEERIGATSEEEIEREEEMEEGYDQEISRQIEREFTPGGESAPDSELEDYDKDGVYIGPDQDNLEVEKDEETGIHKLKQ